MLSGVFLIASGVGLFLAAPAYRDLGGRFARWRADDMRRRGIPRLVTRVADLNASWGVKLGVLLGQALGVAAIVAGIVLLIRA